MKLNILFPNKQSGFTKWNLFFLIICIFFKHLYPVVFCTTWATCISFNISPFFGKKVFYRLAKSLHYNDMVYFQLLYNFIAHILPCGITIIYPPNTVVLKHGLIAILIHGSWGLLVTEGTLLLNKTYVYLEPECWYLLWVFSFAVEILSPIIIYPSITYIHQIIN